MVLYELYDKEHKNIQRETIKYTEAVNMLNFIKSRKYINVSNIEAHTENQVAIRIYGKCDVFMKFTQKQYLKMLPLLVEVNNGNPIEKKVVLK